FALLMPRRATLCPYPTLFRSSDDLVSQVVWRGTRARVAAQRGELAEAERLAHEAADLAARTDFLVVHGDALVDLAEVLSVANRPDRKSTRLNSSHGSSSSAAF